MHIAYIEEPKGDSFATLLVFEQGRNSSRVALAMNVIADKALRHETPVFEKEMRYIVFRPNWNVPTGIQRSELVPAIQRDRNYPSKNNYAVITHSGQILGSGT